MSNHLFGITDKGKVRDNNEDLFIATDVMDGQFTIAGVIDGVGGYEGGEIAAELTKEIVLDELSLIGNDLITQLEIAFNLANEEILARKLVNNAYSRMACVATVAVIDRKNNQLHYIHVGDTRLYLFRDNSLVKISHDQSFVGFLEDSGRLTEEAAMSHPKRNQINQALGLESRMGLTDPYFETGSSPFLSGDLILLCSDGLTDLVDKAGIEAVLSSDDTLEVKGEKLIAAANDAGGKDNVTVVLARNNQVNRATVFATPVVIPDIPVKEIPVAEVDLPVTENTTGVDLPKSANKNILFTIVSLLCLTFLATSVWLYLSRSPKINPPADPIAVLPHQFNAQEKLLMDTLARLKGDTLILSDTVFKQPIILSAALVLQRDTLTIKAKGNIVFKSDSAYKGPAMILALTAKHIAISGILFNGFETGIVSWQNALELSNVRFIGCKQSVQTSFLFPDSSYVNGRVTKRAYQTDSIAKK